MSEPTIDKDKDLKENLINAAIPAVPKPNNLAASPMLMPPKTASLAFDAFSS